MSDGLDYDLQTVDERMNVVVDIINKNDDRLVSYYDNYYNPHVNQTGSLSDKSRMSKDLESLANYLLYAEDSSANEDTITEYKEKRNLKREASIENMIKVRSFKKENNKTIMKVSKVKVNSKDRLEHPELKESGEVIKRLTKMIETGLDSLGNKLTEVEIRKLKWIRTDIQKDEIVVKTELKKYIEFQSVTKPEKDHEALSYIQFDNVEIIRLLIENYSELKQSSYDDTFGYMKLILITLESLIESTNFEPYILEIINMKIDGVQYDEMVSRLDEIYNVKMTNPKLSKMTRETIPKMIVETYKNQREEWYYTYFEKGNYKTCQNCKRNLLAITKYFSPDKQQKTGLKPVCRKCRKIKENSIHKSLPDKNL